MSKSVREIVGDERDKFSVSVDLSIRKVLEYMHENDRAAVAVCDGDEVVGVFSERDLLRRVVRKRVDMDKTTVGESMSTPVYCISVDEQYEVAKAIMVERRLHRLVVMDEQRRFLGFISSQALLEADLSSSRELVGGLNDDYYEPRFTSKNKIGRS
jgi:CBS domain-containing protein